MFGIHDLRGSLLLSKTLTETFGSSVVRVPKEWNLRKKILWKLSFLLVKDEMVISLHVGNCLGVIPRTLISDSR